jgi:TatD DNase family protein
VIDSHTHLHICEPVDTELVTAAQGAGVTKLLTVGTDVSSSRVALETAGLFPGVFAAVGIHPNSATGFGDVHYAALSDLAADPLCLAVGETGLDYFRAGAPEADQRRAFLAQIEIARAVDKPVVIHTREADQDTLDLLDAHAGGVKVILHCFSMPSRIEACLAHPDWWISFAGNVTYPSASELAATVAQVPAERLLVETDAPYLAPQGRRGKPNEPAAVVETTRFLAAARGVAPDELEAALERNAAELFGW